MSIHSEKYSSIMTKPKHRYWILVFMLLALLLLGVVWNSPWVNTYLCTSGQCNKQRDTYLRRPHHKKEIYFSNFENSTSTNLPPTFGQVRNETDLVVVFFAVPKTGSRSVSNPFNMLYTQTPKHLYQIVPYEDRATSESLTSYLTKVPPATFVRGHFPIVDLPRNYVPISVLRDPLERFISEFNFVKHGDGQIETLMIKGHDDPEFELTIDECVRRKGRFCSRESVATYTLKFFCGYDPKCAVANEWTYKQAISNVENKYLMVGITEELNSTMELLEILLPNMSKGVASIYYEKQKVKRESYVTHKTENPSLRTRARLTRMMYWEYKFYNHVKTKFSALKKKFEFPER